ncbi:molybdopterin molybdotransferase [Saccharicrinis carchari]|uniref:Molybdopterin molybdenumtransferase n=1 Tax=Saccharicrinis carchari TaxID=1168039 RepID=A0A521F282_SACCC|nr:molybdopterin molybdotransferase MoeA [Saccharicrinis carchari]SMO90302.1 molybdopterin molybdotransferase [Saccharicrinis carchari]
MIEYTDALKIIVEQALPLPSEKVEINDAHQRVLAGNVRIDMDMPPFNKSAMDGYACRKVDLGNTLQVIETIYAGKDPEKAIGKNQCAKIMTGAVVPEGADCVFMVEDAEMVDTDRIRCTNENTKNNISYRGEDARAGDSLLPDSTLLCARHLPLLAMAGATEVEVYKKPEVSVMVSGTELVEPQEKPQPFQIRNSNSSQLLAQLKDMAIKANYIGITKDDEALLEQTITRAFEKSDVLLLTGGVSVGEYDLIPGILQKLGFDILISKTAIQPGKPMVFAQKGKRYCFGLSGNPVSSFIQFELYVRPFLYALMRYVYRAMRVCLPIHSNFKRRNDARLLLAPGFINQNNEVEPVEFHGSAHIGGLSGAQVLFELPIGIKEVKKGDLVYVRFI